MLPDHIKQYLSFSSKSIIIARLFLCGAILIRVFERFTFFLHYRSQFPSLYNYNLNPFDIKNFSIINGSVILIFTLYSFLTISCLFFIFNKYFHRTNSILLIFLLTLTSYDPIYIGKGLKIFWPYLIFFFCLPQTPLANLKKNISYYNPFINSSIYLFIGLIYFFSFYFKSDPVWRSSFEAIWYFLKSEQWTLDWVQPITQYIKLLKIATITTLFLEVSAISLFLFAGLKLLKFKHWFKNLLSIFFIVFHFTIFILTVLKAFSMGMISLWILFLKRNISTSVVNYKVNLISIGLVFYLFFSIFIWNFFPRHTSQMDHESNFILEQIKKFTLPQHWGLVSPAPGFHNWEVKAFLKKKDKESVLLFSSKKLPENKYFSDAFFTAAFKKDFLLDIYMEKYCDHYQNIITFKYYKNKIVPDSDNFKGNEVFEITKHCRNQHILK